MSDCGCYKCLEKRDERWPSGFPVRFSTFVVCDQCGNKRCPHATYHAYACTGSNEPGQFGSMYGGATK